MATIGETIAPETKTGLFASAKANVDKSGAASTGAVISGFRMVDISLIDKPKNEQPRSSFDDEKLATLASDISALREQGLGIDGTGYLQPIGLAENPNSKGRFVLVFGERRFRAAQQLNDATIPAYVSAAQHDPKTTFLVAISENDERESLSVNDETMAHVRLVTEFEMSVEEVAHLRKKAVSTIREILGRREYDADIWGMLDLVPLSKRAARDIHGLPKGDLRTRLIERVKEGASYAEVSGEIKSYKERQQANELRQKAEAKSQQELSRHAAANPSAQPFARSSTTGGNAVVASQPTQPPQEVPEPVKLPRRPFKEVAQSIEHATGEAWDICKSVPPQGEGRRAMIAAIKKSRENLSLLAHSIGMEVE